jgi:hypothetical protein
MLVIFCADPLHAQEPDSTYVEEAGAADDAGFECALISYEALVEGDNPARAIRSVAARPVETPALYRGWMLRSEHYGRLFEALVARNVRLINTPSHYQHTHYLPESYSIIKEQTPATVWMATGPEVDVDAVMALLRAFNDAPVIVKDFVKSQKHHWAEACYIPSAADRQAVERVVRCFVALQGPDLSGGLVFRAFADLEPLAAHPRSGMPLALEYRTFYLDGRPLYTAPYWDEGDYTAVTPPPDLFLDVARAVESRFFTMDVARRRDGTWIIVELGDGQVAGLPQSADPRDFYARLKTILRYPRRPGEGRESW